MKTGPNCTFCSVLHHVFLDLFFLTILKGGMNDESSDALLSPWRILCPIVRDLCIVRWVDISLKSDQDSMSIFFKWNIWFIDESSRFVKLTHEKKI